MCGIRQKAEKLRREGESIKVIANKVGKSVGTIHKWVRTITVSPGLQEKLNRRGCTKAAARNKKRHKQRSCGLKAQTVSMNSNYNPKAIGDISVARIMAEFIDIGFRVLIPFGDKERYDLVVDEDGNFVRIQCKTGRLVGMNSFLFKARSTNWNTGASQNYVGQADVFAVYLRETKNVYVFNVARTPRNTCTVRLSREDKSPGAQRFADEHLLKVNKPLSTY